MVSQADLISKGYHSLVPGVISLFRDGMGPFNKTYVNIISKKRAINFISAKWGDCSRATRQHPLEPPRQAPTPVPHVEGVSDDIRQVITEILKDKFIIVAASGNTEQGRQGSRKK